MLNTYLLIIDAQNDFCDHPTTDHNPSLPVPGAYQDCLRLAWLIQQAAIGITQIIATLDTHHYIDLAHNTSWRDANGATPPPFSSLTPADIRQGRYVPAYGRVNDSSSNYLLHYLQALAELGRQFTLWPPHCLLGSPGHNLNPNLAKAIQDWECQTGQPAIVIQKGENMWTESFSALKAVIPYPGDPGTELNLQLLELLNKADRLLIAGQASSHCVRETLNDLLLFANPSLGRKLVILSDCMSPVPGFETEADAFFADLKQQGIRLTSSTAILPELNSTAF